MCIDAAGIASCRKDYIALDSLLVIRVDRSRPFRSTINASNYFISRFSLSDEKLYTGNKMASPKERKASSTDSIEIDISLVDVIYVRVYTQKLSNNIPTRKDDLERKKNKDTPS
jgi:hypothetical protein